MRPSATRNLIATGPVPGGRPGSARLGRGDLRGRRLTRARRRPRACALPDRGRRGARLSLRAGEALRWAALGLLAAVVLVCCAFPTIRLGVGGFIGGGESQRTFDLDRDVALVPGLLPRSLVVVIPALALLGTAIAGLRLGSLRPVALAAFAAGVALAIAVYRVETHLTFIEHGAVIGCDHPCTGFALVPAVKTSGGACCNRHRDTVPASS